MVPMRYQVGYYQAMQTQTDIDLGVARNAHASPPATAQVVDFLRLTRGIHPVDWCRKPERNRKV